MTCIIGVVCDDGIVLVADKKVRAGEMAHYENKIIPMEGYEAFVIASAGYLDIREKFMSDMNKLSVLLKKGILKEDPSRGFVGLTEDIAHRLWEIYAPRYKALNCNYESEAFEAFVCFKGKSGEPYLYHVDAVGISRKVDTYQVLGTGALYAHLFIRPSHPEYGDMRGMAVIATFIILLINEYGIDESIGIEKGDSVQIWKFPNRTKSYEVHGSELKQIMKEAIERLKKFSNFMILGRTKI